MNKIRQAKKSKIIAHLSSLHNRAIGALEDRELLAYFNQLHRNIKEDRSHQVDSRLEFEIDRFFVKQYRDFYDMIFIDSSGYVFQTVRRESDYCTNIFQNWPGSGLARGLKRQRQATFVDYQIYQPSDEPAAFHIVPVWSGRSLKGWIVFQQAINSINRIMTDHSDMGFSEETYLINANNLMLSDSRFYPEGSILQREIVTKAVTSASTRGIGNLLISDYRDVMVYSSFEKFSFLDVSWVIVAEIDEGEVITDYFLSRSEEIYADLVQSGRLTSPYQPPLSSISLTGNKVDMDEYVAVRSGEKAYTAGVAQCTAVAIIYQGRFGFLAHIAPTDAIYIDSFSDHALGTSATDLLGDLWEQMTRFEIYPHEVNQLQVSLIAPHGASFKNIIKFFATRRVNLDQITVLYNPEATSANVSVDLDKGEVIAQWCPESGRVASYSTVEKTVNLGLLVRNRDYSAR